MPKIKLIIHKKRKIEKNSTKKKEIRLIIDLTKQFKKLHIFVDNYFCKKNQFIIDFLYNRNCFYYGIVLNALYNADKMQTIYNIVATYIK
jgi:hypothetical protein